MYVVTLDAVANFILLTVNGTYSSANTVITLAAGAGSLPTPPFNLTWWDSTKYFDPATDPNGEIIRVTAVDVGAQQITVLRGQEGTSASGKNNVGDVYLMILGISAKMIGDIQTGLRQAFQLQNLVGAINSSNTVYTFTPAPVDLNSVSVSLARQPQIQGVDIDVTISGPNGVVTYISGAPDASLNGMPHVVQYI